VRDRLGGLSALCMRHGEHIERVIVVGVFVTNEPQVGDGLIAGRASGQVFDLRSDFPRAPYDLLAMRMAGASGGDVAARVAVRFDEVKESFRLVRAILDGLPEGDVSVALNDAPANRQALGFVEGWRGPVFVAVTSAPGNGIRRCHPHDPSWQNWPVLEHAIIDNIVPDFPLINKSFNLTYSGHDL